MKMMSRRLDRTAESATVRGSATRDAINASGYRRLIKAVREAIVACAGKAGAALLLCKLIVWLVATVGGSFSRRQHLLWACLRCFWYGAARMGRRFLHIQVQRQQSALGRRLLRAQGVLEAHWKSRRARHCELGQLGRGDMAMMIWKLSVSRQARPGHVTQHTGTFSVGAGLASSPLQYFHGFANVWSRSTTTPNCEQDVSEREARQDPLLAEAAEPAAGLYSPGLHPLPT